MVPGGAKLAAYIVFGGDNLTKLIRGILSVVKLTPPLVNLNSFPARHDEGGGLRWIVGFLRAPDDQEGEDADRETGCFQHGLHMSSAYDGAAICPATSLFCNQK